MRKSAEQTDDIATVVFMRHECIDPHTLFWQSDTINS